MCVYGSIGELLKSEYVSMTYIDADLHRNLFSQDSCGPEGKFWEEKD